MPILNFFLQWRSSFGGLCAAQPRSCDFRESTPQDNWFFTQYIRYIHATEVFVNIATNFQECRLSPSCNQLYVDMYRYERNGVNATAARTTNNYQLVQRIEQSSDFNGQQYAAFFTFTPSGNTNGFYLGFRDSGTCVNILRIQVYHSTLFFGKIMKWGTYIDCMPSSLCFFLCKFGILTSSG